MAFFKTSQDESSAEAAPASTYIAAGSHIEGRISGRTEVQIDGSLDGVVTLEGPFVVAPRGRIQGDVMARSVRVAGRVKGNIRAKEKIDLASSGSIEGDMTAPLLSVAEGGTGNGLIQIGGTLPNGSSSVAGSGSKSTGPTAVQP